jgi:hypothetical protein
MNKSPSFHRQATSPNSELPARVRDLVVIGHTLDR